MVNIPKSLEIIIVWSVFSNGFALLSNEFITGTLGLVSAALFGVLGVLVYLKLMDFENFEDEVKA